MTACPDLRSNVCDTMFVQRVMVYDAYMEFDRLYSRQ